MLRIQRAMVNGGGEPAWIEIENDGGEVELARYGVRVQQADGNERDVWQGRAEDMLGGMGTLRLTDGSERAVPAVALGLGPMILPVEGLDLSGTLGRTITLFWMDGNMAPQSETVTVRAGAPVGQCLYRNGNELVGIDRRPYHP
jgi:hypothetical protein